ncbi:hypothetical protein BC939DRAFT_466945 [Gamsiella multidivaricata]|uniref:uncharacterized protein n=1 Tax=Gamsiella multidivaricata TaxID=101098 RepID=UPI00221E68DC|nr:uncharacterized protein BC939DRAFT_466945 [Gamsiella multidivaricata]KAI7817125.1 hypothetical protein BC939DRAFT_466945 [Gamsiella multidivaricata]
MTSRSCVATWPHQHGPSLMTLTMILRPVAIAQWGLLSQANQGRRLVSGSLWTTNIRTHLTARSSRIRRLICNRCRTDSELSSPTLMSVLVCPTVPSDNSSSTNINIFGSFSTKTCNTSNTSNTCNTSNTSSNTNMANISLLHFFIARIPVLTLVCGTVLTSRKASHSSAA